MRARVGLTRADSDGEVEGSRLGGGPAERRHGKPLWLLSCRQRIAKGRRNHDG